MLDYLLNAQAAGRRVTEREVARSANAHPSQVGRLLIKATGLGFCAWRNGFALRPVVLDLIWTDAAVKAIAYDRGFLKPEQLDRIFRRTTGMTPTMFRHRIRTALELSISSTPQSRTSLR